MRHYLEAALYVSAVWAARKWSPKWLGFIGLLCCVTVPLHAQSVAFIGLEKDVYGITICTTTNEPLILLSSKIERDSSAVTRTLIHEMVHVGDARSYPGGCNAFMTRYAADSAFQFEVEFRAYCKGAQYDVASGINPSFVAVHLAVFLIDLYSPNLTKMQVLQRCRVCVGLAPGADR